MPDTSLISLSANGGGSSFCCQLKNGFKVDVCVAAEVFLRGSMLTGCCSPSIIHHTTNMCFLFGCIMLLFILSELVPMLGWQLAPQLMNPQKQYQLSNKSFIFIYSQLSNKSTGTMEKNLPKSLVVLTFLAVL